jgi:hypothetical protein
VNYICDITVQKGRLTAGCTVRGSNLSRIKFSSPSRHPEAYLASYPVGHSGVKRLECGVNHPPHLVPMLKKEYIYTVTPNLFLHDLYLSPYRKVPCLAAVLTCPRFFLSPGQASEDVWTSRTLSAFQTFPRNIIQSPLTFMNGTDSSDDLRYLADGSRTTSIPPIWLQVRLYREFVCCSVYTVRCYSRIFSGMRSTV